METTRTSFEESLRFGQEGEHEVARVLLQKAGVTLMPLYQFDTTHAPFLLTFDFKKITCPDLLYFKQGKAYMVEVKTKNQWVRFLHKTLETGLDLRLWQEYRKIQQESNIPVYVFFNHKQESPLGIYFCHIDTDYRLWDGLSQTGKRIQGEMVLYPYDSLHALHVIEEDSRFDWQEHQKFYQREPDPPQLTLF